MSKINFKKTGKGYSADYQRNSGFGFKRLYYKSEEVKAEAARLGWGSPDEKVPGEEWTVAEMLISGRLINPFRVVQFF